jgi:heme O synthase-like polyprenyltransferase
MAAALAASLIAGTVGLVCLFSFNLLTGLLGLLALVSYAFVYTPLKARTALSVFVGAIPGALPPMIGYVAATGDFGIEPGTLFAVQFMCSSRIFGPSHGWRTTTTRRPASGCFRSPAAARSVRRGPS